MRKNLIWLLCFLAPAMVIAQSKTGFSNIAWDQSTLQQVSPAEGRGANYARIIQLSNGSLVGIYEANGIECVTSNDAGKTWSKPVSVAASIPGINMSVPDILELNDHSLLASYNPRPRRVNGDPDTTKRFGIRTKKSYDGGNTWQDERLIYEASYKSNDGCWEPTQIQLPSGEIQLFFSNEGIYRQSNEQNISIFRSTDNGLTWTKSPQIVSFRTGHRDGMPVPIILKGTNELVFSIEDNAIGEFKPSIIRNSFNQNWQKPVGPNDAERTYALATRLPDTVYAGAPFLRQLHSGPTVLSYQGTQNRRHNWQLACMQVAIGDSDARNFKTVDMPFNVPIGKHGLWNSLCILNDDTVIAVTSTNAYGNANAIWMIKGHLVK